MNEWEKYFRGLLKEDDRVVRGIRGEREDGERGLRR